MLLKDARGNGRLAEPALSVPESPCGTLRPFRGALPYGCPRQDAGRERLGSWATHAQKHSTPCSPGQNVPSWLDRYQEIGSALLTFFSFLMLKLISSLCLAATVFTPGAVQAASSCGHASYYGVGDGYHGRRAANGSVFDAYGYTTAHPSLPFGTTLQVTNQSNGKSVVVKVTDRGPFIAGRVLDLSYGAFSRISSPSSGVAHVCYSRV